MKNRNVKDFLKDVKRSLENPHYQCLNLKNVEPLSSILEKQEKNYKEYHRITNVIKSTLLQEIPGLTDVDYYVYEDGNLLEILCYSNEDFLAKCSYRKDHLEFEGDKKDILMEYCGLLKKEISNMLNNPFKSYHFLSLNKDFSVYLGSRDGNLKIMYLNEGNSKLKTIYHYNDGKIILNSSLLNRMYIAALRKESYLKPEKGMKLLFHYIMIDKKDI